MSRMLDILQAFLSYHNYKYFRLDGATHIDQRQAMMERFNTDDSIFCFILSTRSGGIGVNLTGADTVIFYDSDWNPVGSFLWEILIKMHFFKDDGCSGSRSMPSGNDKN
jgi:SNF2 family DNA or RNA helicase